MAAFYYYYQNPSGFCFLVQSNLTEITKFTYETKTVMNSCLSSKNMSLCKLPIHAAFKRFTDFIWIEIRYFKSCKNTRLVMHKLFCRLKGLCHEDIALQILSGSTNHNNHFGWPNFFKFQIHTHPRGPLQQTTGNQNLLN